MPRSISSGSVRLNANSLFRGEKNKSPRLPNINRIFKRKITIHGMPKKDKSPIKQENTKKAMNSLRVGSMPLSWNRSRAHKLFDDLLNGYALQFHMRR